MVSYLVHQQISKNHKTHIILETKIPTAVYFIRTMSRNNLSRNYSSCESCLGSKWFSVHLLSKESYFSCTKFIWTMLMPNSSFGIFTGWYKFCGGKTTYAESIPLVSSRH